MNTSDLIKSQMAVDGTRFQAADGRSLGGLINEHPHEEHQCGEREAAVFADGSAIIIIGHDWYTADEYLRTGEEPFWEEYRPVSRICPACKDRPSVDGTLCEECRTSGHYLECEQCGAWESVDTLRQQYGDSLGGWVMISEGPTTLCPECRPCRYRPGLHDLDREAERHG